MQQDNPELSAEIGVEIIGVNYTDLDSAKKVLEDNNIHTILSALSLQSQEQSDAQIGLIRAAAASSTDGSDRDDMRQAAPCLQMISNRPPEAGGLPPPRRSDDALVAADARRHRRAARRAIRCRRTRTVRPCSGPLSPRAGL